MHRPKPLLLLILDGWGYSDIAQNNAISLAKTPAWRQLWQQQPHTCISASGLDVGLPAGQMGNSEVGHMTMGAGRVIFQDLTRINNAISDGTFARNPTILQAIDYANQKHAKIHIMGLLSPGGVHSSEEHIQALIKILQQHACQDIYLHAFLDGRDTPPKSAKPSITKFAPYLASIMGRFYAMDRDKRLERTQAAADLLLNGKAPFNNPDPLAALDAAYTRGETDEFVQPTIIKPITIADDDVVIFMNFRNDRARQVCHALLTAKPSLKSNFITLTEYEPGLTNKVIFPPQIISDTFSEIIQQQHLTQLHIAETEKYAHVTFFFNAGREAPVENEERILIPSPKVSTYDQAPQMSAHAITDVLVEAIKSKKYDVIIANFANADMVGHTGIIPATISAIETIDQCLSKIVAALKEHGGEAVITADHGNAETMWDETSGQPHTAHTTNLVPFVYVGPRELQFKTDRIYGLQDVAPTLLYLLGLPIPKAMTGTPLIN